MLNARIEHKTEQARIEAEREELARLRQQDEERKAAQARIEAEAKAKAEADAKAKAEAKMGEQPAYLWDDAVVQWCKETTHKATQPDDLAKLRWLVAYLGQRPLTQINRKDIQRIGAIKAAETSPATANRYLALIRAILIRAQRVWEWIDRVPAVTLYPEPANRIRWLTQEQADRLLTE